MIIRVWFSQEQIEGNKISLICDFCITLGLPSMPGKASPRFPMGSLGQSLLTPCTPLSSKSRRVKGVVSPYQKIILKLIV
jgi:hypothetical protein